MMMFKIVNYNYNQPNIWEIKVYLVKNKIIFFFFNFKIDQQINVFPYHRYWYSIQLRERSVQTTVDIEGQSA